jgi:hypothetical protein
LRNNKRLRAIEGLAILPLDALGRLHQGALPDAVRRGAGFTFPVNKEALVRGPRHELDAAAWVMMELSAGARMKRLVANQSDYAIYYRLSFRLL